MLGRRSRLPWWPSGPAGRLCPCEGMPWSGGPLRWIIVLQDIPAAPTVLSFAPRPLRGAGNVVVAAGEALLEVVVAQPAHDPSQHIKHPFFGCLCNHLRPAIIGRRWISAQLINLIRTSRAAH